MANLTSPDGVVTATVVIANQEPNGAYPIQITAVTPQGQQIAVEYNGVRVYDEITENGTGSEG